MSSPSGCYSVGCGGRLPCKKGWIAIKKGDIVARRGLPNCNLAHRKNRLHGRLQFVISKIAPHSNIKQLKPHCDISDERGQRWFIFSLLNEELKNLKNPRILKITAVPAGAISLRLLDGSQRFQRLRLHPSRWHGLGKDIAATWLGFERFFRKKKPRGNTWRSFGWSLGLITWQLFLMARVVADEGNRVWPFLEQSVGDLQSEPKRGCMRTSCGKKFGLPICANIPMNIYNHWSGDFWHVIVSILRNVTFTSHIFPT